MAEFLSKATGTAVDWVQMPGMKVKYVFVVTLWCDMCVLERLTESFFFFCVQPGPDSVGIFAISQKCNGVAARACGLVSLEPMKVKELPYVPGSKIVIVPIFFFFFVPTSKFNCRLLRYSKIGHLGSVTAGALKFSQCSLLVIVERLNSYICR